MQAAADPTVTQTLVLTRADVLRFLDLDTCIRVVESAFQAHGTGAADRPGVLGVHAAGGGFHIKAGLLEVEGRAFFAAKTNGNFPGNPTRFALPTIQGVVALCDARNGRLLALMDSIAITTLRTAAATAVAAKYLARADTPVVTLIGCGAQGAVQLRALTRVRLVRRVFAIDTDPIVAKTFAKDMGDALGLDIEVTGDVRGAVLASDLCVTCTPSTKPLVHCGDVPAGCFVAGVGADCEDKWELAPDLLAGARVVVDVLDQAAAIGDLHHAIAGGSMTRDAVHAELGEVVAGRRAGRVSEDEITVFDSTGMALQDVAAAAAAYSRAIGSGGGTFIDFGG